jgi:shikimate dehydrogenase
MKKLRLALIGKDVSLSDSKKIHEFILKQWNIECDYRLISLKKEELDGVVKELLVSCDGFNVTIPYKLDVMEYMKEIVGKAKEFGSVNTVVCSTVTGYNTDGVGFMQMLYSAGISVEGKRVLILGGGGAARSCAVALKKSGAKVFMYQRSRDKLLKTCQELSVIAVENVTAGYDILINATGVGMHDSVGRSPVQEGVFIGAEKAIDLIYNPEKTEFLRLAEGQGVGILNGWAMLFYQAYYSDCYYLNRSPDKEEAARFYEKYIKTVD